MFSFYVSVLLSVASLIHCYKVQKYPLLMPNVRPEKPDLYLCTSVRVNFTNYYIVGFEPNASMENVHHMLIYGCRKPGNTNPVWDCGEMSANSNDGGRSGWEKGSVCKSEEEVIYAWAKGAPKLELPPEVGFKIGGNSSIQYLVLEVHYSNVEKFKDGTTDDSGVFLEYTEKPMSKLAAVYTLATDGKIPPMSEERMEAACVIQEDKIIRPFAYRTHTHGLGKVVSGYMVRHDSDGQLHWTLIGKRDPQLPQMFFPVANAMTLFRGDIIAARCTMVSNRTTITRAGPTNDDEMCNFYMMYFVEGGEPLKQKFCVSAGPPSYYWGPELTKILDKEASTLN